ncbi:DUF4365 domain-containing protein [Halobacteriovorax sp. RZ-1]|uniref:DUF4365 domain-containing protein n=1 Tax=unclassified Halobacteriovorax TaxID=2639665 RepID=UPI003713535B
MKNMPNRHRTHQLETESVNAFKREVPSSWVIREVEKDYGIDLEVEIFESTGDATAEKFYVQLKSTDSTKKTDHLKESGFKVQTYNYLCKQKYPVLIAKYNSQNDTIYYKWTFEKLKSPIRNNAKSFTFHFEEVKIFKNEVMKDITIDLKNYLSFTSNKDIETFRLKIISNTSSFEIFDFIKCLNFSNKHNKILFDMYEYDGTIKLSKDHLELKVAGGASSFIYPLQHNETPESIIEKILFSLGFLLVSAEKVRLGIPLVSNTYKTLSLNNVETLTHLISSLIKIKNYEIIEEIHHWCLNEEKNTNISKSISTFLLSFLPRDRESHNLVERILGHNLQHDIKEGDDTQIAISQYNLGRFFLRENPLKAFFYLNEARKNDNKYLERDYYWKELGSVTYRKRKYSTSKILYQRSIEIKPQSITIAYLGDCYLHSLEFEDALKSFTLAIEKDCKRELPSRYRLLEIILPLIISDINSLNSEATDESISRDNFVELKKLNHKISEDLIEPNYWFNKAIFMNNIQKFEAASVIFCWCALLHEKDNESWANAIISLFNLEKKSNKDEDKNFLNIIVEIFKEAYFCNGEEFFYYLMQRLEEVTLPGYREQISELMILLHKEVQSPEKCEIRIHGDEDKTKVLEYSKKI